MAKFKLGDKAYYFHAEWDGHICMDDLALCYVNITTPEMVDAYNQAPLYHKTKRAALNTMAKKLKEFVDHEEVNQD